MSSGVLVFAYNNSAIDYVKQAAFAAKRVKEYLGLPTSLITDAVEYAEQFNVFDQVIFKKSTTITAKTYNNGTMHSQKLAFKNDTRPCAYDLTPYEKTLLIDSDFIVGDNTLLNAFESDNEFMIYKDAYDIAGFRDYKEFDKISETGVDFYWATCVYFTKTDTPRIFFNLLQHIQTYWTHYRQIYRLETPVYRNDHVFSIAIHIINGFMPGDFAKKLPGRLYYITDQDSVVAIKDNTYKLLLAKDQYLGQYTLAKYSGSLHIMNKFSLMEHIDV
jgi:hypothetical protein